MTSAPSTSKPVSPWPGGIDVLLFCVTLTLFVFLGIFALGAVAETGALKLAPPETTLFRYGGTSVLIALLLCGTLSFLVGGFATRRLKRVRARWLSALVGALYAIVMVSVSMLVPLEKGSPAAIATLGFQFLFPALGLTLGALTLKRSYSVS